MPPPAYVRAMRSRIGHDLLMTTAVNALLWDDGGRVLLMRRRDDGLWNPPGGLVEPGESPAQALIREVWEESGLRVLPERLVAVSGGLAFRYRYPNGDVNEILILFFACRILTGAPVLHDDEATEWCWADPASPPPLAQPYPAGVLSRSVLEQPPLFEWNPSWLDALPPP